MSVDLPATLLFVLVTTFTPGPNNILAASMGALHGYRRALPFLLGVAGGFLTLMLICASLSTALNAFLPAAAPVLRYVGAAYILWLALGVYRDSTKPLDSSHATRPLGFLSGLTLQFVNVKGAFFGLTLYSLFLVSLLGDPLTLIVSPILLTLVAFSAVSTWTIGGQAIRRLLTTPARARALGLTLSAALVYTALDIAGVIVW